MTCLTSIDANDVVPGSSPGLLRQVAQLVEHELDVSIPFLFKTINYDCSI